MIFPISISNSSGTRPTCLFRINRDKTWILDFLSVKILCLLPSNATFISFIHNSHTCWTAYNIIIFFFFFFGTSILLLKLVVHNERGWWAMLPSHVLVVSIHMLSPFIICRYHICPCFRTRPSTKLILRSSSRLGRNKHRRMQVV